MARAARSKVTVDDVLDAVARDRGVEIPPYEELHAKFAGPETSQQRFGRMIREARSAKGLTQSELSKLARITQPRLVLIEHGRANPTLATMERLVRALGATELRLPLPA